PVDASEDSVNNPLRVLCARVVRRDDDVITQPRRHLPHQRTFARITISTATKHCNQTPSGFRSHELQDLLKGVWSMGVIHKHREILAAINTLKAPWHACELRNALRNGPGVNIEGNGRGDPSQEIVDVVTSDQGRSDLQLSLRG